MAKKIGQILLESDMISTDQLQQALQAQQQTGERLGAVLIKLGLLSKEDILSSLSMQFGVPVIDLETFQMELELAKERQEFFTKIVGVRLPFRLTKIFLNLNIPEYVVAAAMVIMGLAGALLLTFNHLSILLGFFLLIGFYLFDYVGGQLARIRKKASLLGSVRTRFIHLVLETLSILCLGCWLINSRQYDQWLVFVIIFVMLFWHKSQKFLSHLRLMLYFSELMAYKSYKTELIKENYKKIIASKRFEVRQPESPKSPLKSVITRLRLTSYAFSFFVFSFFLISLVDYILIRFSIYLHLKIIFMDVFAIYYLLNIIDFAYSYLFTDKIYREVNELEQMLRQQLGHE